MELAIFKGDILPKFFHIFLLLFLLLLLFVFKGTLYQELGHCFSKSLPPPPVKVLSVFK